MKYCYLLILSISLTLSIEAQIDIKPDIVLFDFEENDSFNQVFLTVTNNFSETQLLYWRFEEGDDFPEDWVFSIKDNNVCYNPGDYDCHPLLPNTIYAGDSISILFYFLSPIVEGSSWGVLCLYSDSLFVNEIACTSPPTNNLTDNSNNDKLLLYPNPVKDEFSIQYDLEVKTIEIINLSGHLIRKENHIRGQSHSTFGLQSGSYILVLRNKSKELIKTLKLFKE